MVGRTFFGNVTGRLWVRLMCIKIVGLAVLQHMKLHAMDTDWRVLFCTMRVGIADKIAIHDQNIVRAKDFDGCIGIDDNACIRLDVYSYQKGVGGDGREECCQMLMSAWLGEWLNGQ